MAKCIICGKEGEKHHIVFKSQGGLDIPINYIYLCSEHHRGKNGPHKNNKVDIIYKLKLQDKLEKILYKDYYLKKELGDILKINQKQVQMLINDLKKYKKGYNKLEILKKLMGGKLYYKYMLDDFYDESWNVFEDEIYNLEINLRSIE